MLRFVRRSSVSACTSKAKSIARATANSFAKVATIGVAEFERLVPFPTIHLSMTILETTRGTPWTSDGFKTSWGKDTRKAGIDGLTFHDLRGTAITRLALAGCSVPEIATITGHSLNTVNALLDAHYLHRDPAQSESTIRKLDAHRSRTGLQTALQTALQTVPLASPAGNSEI